MQIYFSYVILLYDQLNNENMQLITINIFKKKV